ncbi:MAG: glycosyltransferase family 2 protein [Dehalococcoidia bacterium]|nr:glycosyltransferase family 2 protein [Dehalococcoidia bacterium]
MGSRPGREAIEPLITAVIPAYRGRDLVVGCVQSLLASEGVRVEIVVVNNDEKGSLGSILAAFGPSVRLVEPGRNTGYAAACNAGVRLARGEFVLFCNQDLQASPRFLAELAAAMERHPRAVVVGGKVLRPGRGGGTALIDSAGVGLRRSRAPYDRGEGQVDAGQFDREEQVFAVSGAALFARRTALDDVMDGGEVLDESFFMYKEDVDLCWRLRLRGGECWYVPAAGAWHARTARGLAGRGYLRHWRAYLAGERRKPRHVRLHSLKNQWILLIKNETIADVWRDLPVILGRECLVLGVTFLTSPRVFAEAVRAFARALPAAVGARRRIQSVRRIPGGSLRAWFRG